MADETTRAGWGVEQAQEMRLCSVCVHQGARRDNADMPPVCAPCLGKTAKVNFVPVDPWSKGTPQLNPERDAITQRPEADKPTSALDTQVGGSHYKQFAIQPVEFVHQNGLGFIVGSIIKYICRYKFKAGKQDLEKARHFLDMLIEQEYPQ
ncbi:hypothetical protein [Caulobacter phage ERS]|uniref:DUF3310 domain-containing protein n=1 Tax=Caulobacter phage ERS TaxID=3020392 RepID=A0AAE9X4Y7_9CAUD|nr:hypothetical protein [Caulobacter phage ERS]